MPRVQGRIESRLRSGGPGQTECSKSRQDRTPQGLCSFRLELLPRMEHSVTRLAHCASLA
jgi:hypothetical protein